MAYGEDAHTAECEARFRELFGPTTQTFLAFTGTGANVLALATMLKPAHAIVCTNWSHIAVDETGAPERILGAKLIDLPSDDGKLRPGAARGARPPDRCDPPRPARRRLADAEHRARHAVHAGRDRRAV